MLNISFVLYNPDWQQVDSLLGELVRINKLHNIYLIDNSLQSSEQRDFPKGKVTYLWQQGRNLGYGRGHNIAIRESVYEHIPLHLVINSDIEVTADSIERLCNFMLSNPDVGALNPKIFYPNGELQRNCRLLPTPIDVFARRFLPNGLIRRRNERYELHQSGYEKILNVPYLNGCFMLLRTEALLKAGLFDERYFMYPEDIDLTRTIHRDYLTLFVPDISIIHHHQRASYHSWKMLWIHMVNMCRYFNKWGWIFDKERKLMNNLTLLSLNTE